MTCQGYIIIAPPPPPHPFHVFIYVFMYDTIVNFLFQRQVRMKYYLENRGQEESN